MKAKKTRTRRIRGSTPRTTLALLPAAIVRSFFFFRRCLPAGGRRTSFLLTRGGMGKGRETTTTAARDQDECFVPGVDVEERGGMEIVAIHKNSHTHTHDAVMLCGIVVGFWRKKGKRNGQNRQFLQWKRLKTVEEFHSEEIFVNF